MPPLPALKTPAMTRLETSLKGQPRSVVTACIARAEALALDLDPAIKYPEEWVIFRLTGRNSASASSDLLSGDELRRELSPLVERLSAYCDLTAHEAGEGALDPATLCRQWGISRATLDRLRRRGLVALRIKTAEGRERVLFRAETVRAFEAAHTQSLERARAFSRVDARDADRIVRRAERYREKLGWSLNQSAARLSRRYGRSQEGVRQLLVRAAERGRRTLKEAPALDDRRRKVLFRAWRRGVDLALMARKSHRSRGSVRRAINLERAQRLRSIAESGALAGPTLPSFKAKDAPATILTQLPARSGLAAPFPRELVAFLKAARSLGPPIGAEEKARLVAYQFLRFEAARIIGKLDPLQPSASAVDRAETYLLWGARLKAELIRSQLRIMLDTLTARLGKPVEELGVGPALQVITDSLRVLGDAVDTHDLAKGGRLAAAVAVLLDRYGAHAAKELLPPPSQPRRAVPVLAPGIVLPDWERQVSAWQTQLEPDPRLQPAVRSGKTPADAANVLAKRYGWDGGPPRTMPELAAELNVSRVRVLAADQRALRAALRAIRA